MMSLTAGHALPLMDVMKTCVVCGNDIPATLAVCHFCGSPQPGGPPRGGGGGVVTVNLERGRPTVDEAMRTLDMRLAEARARGTRLLRIIHGYGSSGAGGGIGEATGRALRALAREGRIRAHVAGADYPDGSRAARDLLARHPALRRSLRTDRGNPGITFVEM